MELEERFKHLFKKLKVVDTQTLINRWIRPVDMIWKVGEEDL